MQSSKSVSMKVNRYELTVLQGRKQFSRTLGATNPQTIEQRIMAVAQLYHRSGKLPEPNPIHLMQIGLFLKQNYHFLLLGDIQPLFFLASKGVIKPIQKVELSEIAEVVEDYWQFVQALILRMREVIR